MKEMIAQTWYACKTVFYYVPLSACYVFLYYGFRAGFSIITASVIVTICNAVGDLSSGSNSRLWKYLIFYVLLYMAAQLMSLLFAVAVNPYIYEKIKDILNRKLSFAIQNMGIIALEDANVLERIHKAKACVEDCNLSICFMRIVSFLGNLGGAIGILAILWGWNLWVAIFSLASIIPDFLVRMNASKKEYSYRQEAAEQERKQQSLWLLFSTRNAIKELKVFGCGSYLLNKWKKQTQDNYSILWKIKKKEISLLSICVGGKLFGFFAGLAIVAWNILSGNLLAGVFASALSSIPSFQNQCCSLWDHLSSIRKSALFIQNFSSILKQQGTFDRNETSTFQPLGNVSINVEHISFAYPNSNEKFALDDISFEIQQGETVVIVGENGAGKSTLVKCLLGLYPVTQGTVSYGNHKLHPAQERMDYQKVSVVTHDFPRYSLTLRENITLQDTISVEYDNQIREILSMLEFYKNISLDQYLGPEFGGTDLSGGEWQKIALARGLYKNSNLIVLDEPSSQMDPQNESFILHKLLESAKGRTALIISHRVGLCRYADRILVLDRNHRLVGNGTHNNLMTNCYVYRNLYQKQAQWYQEERKEEDLMEGKL